jgi:4-amino-4-deoxy-L-arabinose transferase-like glycosyltransferase
VRNILIALVFVILNSYWVLQDNTIPAIGDDARFLHESAMMTQVISNGDTNEIWNKWQNLFIEDTTSVPRTPLFTLTAVPAFLNSGFNEDSALLTNIGITGLTSILLALFVKELFGHKSYNETLATLSVILFNLMPATYGFSRLYMSEMLQAFFVLLISLLYLKFRHDLKYWQYFLLGIMWGLALLLRVLMPIYLLVPTIFFIIWQLELKKAKSKYLFAFLIFLLPTLGLAATWYAPNFSTYFNFVGDTSMGEIAGVTSLGPVLSPLTWLRFWKVILTWHLGWPLLAFSSVAILIFILKQSKFGIFKTFLRDKMVNLLKENFSIENKKQVYNAKLFLTLSFIPALIITTASLNKTARYFFPVEPFIIVLFAYFLYKVWESNLVIAKLYIIIGIIFIAIPFVNSLGFGFPGLPYTNLMYSSAQFQVQDKDFGKFEFVLESLSRLQGKYYILPETVDFNDAALIWKSDQKGLHINSVGEFSLYNTFEQGLQKISQADIVILQDNAVLADMYQDKYLQLAKTIKEDGRFTQIGSRNFDDGIIIQIYLRNN